MSVRTKHAAVAKARARTESAAGEATRTQLLEKAEELFAEHGVEPVSLRQIGVAIGSSNASVVAYHFGTKQALLRAIIFRHLPHLEASRASLVSQAIFGGREHDLFALLEALCRPVFELRTPEGRRRYAMLLWQINSTCWWSEDSYTKATPVLEDLQRRIAAQLPRLTHEDFVERMYTIGDLMTGALRRSEHQGLDDARAESIFTRTLRLGCMVLLAYD